MVMFKPSTEEDIVVWEKRKMGLALWAATRVTPEQKRLADGIFYTFVFMLRKATGCDYLTALREAPYVIPEKAQNKNPFGPQVNLLHILDEYEGMLGLAKEIQRRKWRNQAAKLIAFKEKFPGLPEARLQTYSCWPAAKIAGNYLAWKYKLPVSDQAVKKYLTKLRPQMRTINWLFADLDRRGKEKPYLALQSFKETLQKSIERLEAR